MPTNKPQDKRLWLGVLLLAIGGALALNKGGIMPFRIPYYFFRWEIILISVGAFLVFAKEKRNVGFTLMAIGGFFFLRTLLPSSYSDLLYGWPSLFIILGLIFLLKRDRRDHHNIPVENELDYIDEMAIFGSANRTVTSQNFMGGKITTVFGGADINLTKATLSPDRSEVDILTIFGGSTLIVPPDWNVRIKVVSIFGAYDDERLKSGMTTGQSSQKELVIKGFVLFGGGEVKSY